MSISIYKIDSSKLIPIGKEGYRQGQEQAKTYLDKVPKEEFTAAITGEDVICRFGVMADLDLSGNNRVLVHIDNRETERLGMTVYFYDLGRQSANHCTIAHPYCKDESNYDLAKKLLGFIEDAFYSEKDKTVDDLIANAESQKKEKGCGEKRFDRDFARE